MNDLNMIEFSIAVACLSDQAVCIITKHMDDQGYFTLNFMDEASIKLNTGQVEALRDALDSALKIEAMF